MSSAALGTTDTPSTPPATRPRVKTLQQEEIVREFTETYGIDASQISFDGEKPEPLFDFEALNLLATTLGNFPSIITEIGDVDGAMGLVTSSCEIKLPDGRRRVVFGAAVVGEDMPEEKLIETIPQALNVAQARALRKGLRAVGWDAFRAHRQQGENILTFNPSPDIAKNEIAELHILAKDVGLITSDGDKTNYYRMMAIWFPGVKTSKELDEVQRAQMIATLRGLKKSKTVSIKPSTSVSAESPQS
jgi:hypothetical protein